MVCEIPQPTACLHFTLNKQDTTVTFCYIFSPWILQHCAFCRLGLIRPCSLFMAPNSVLSRMSRLTLSLSAVWYNVAITFLQVQKVLQWRKALIFVTYWGSRNFDKNKEERKKGRGGRCGVSHLSALLGRQRHWRQVAVRSAWVKQSCSSQRRRPLPGQTRPAMNCLICCALIYGAQVADVSGYALPFFKRKKRAFFQLKKYFNPRVDCT